MRCVLQSKSSWSFVREDEEEEFIQRTELLTRVPRAGCQEDRVWGECALPSMTSEAHALVHIWRGCITGNFRTLT